MTHHQSKSSPPSRKNLEQWLGTQRHGDMLWAAIQRTASDLRRHKLRGSYDVAKRTAELLRNFVGGSRWPTAAVLMERIKELGRFLSRAQPIELTVGNIVRRVLFIVREAVRDAAGTGTDGGRSSLVRQSTLIPETCLDLGTCFVL